MRRPILKRSQGAVCPEYLAPRNRGHCTLRGLSLGLYPRPRRPTLLAGAPIPQKLPGIYPQLMAVVPMKLDGVFAHSVRRFRPGQSLEHGQRSRRGLRRLSRFSSGLASLLVTKRAGAGVAQERERIVRSMAVFPLDVHTRARGQVHFDGFGVGGRHRFKYRISSAYRRTRSRPFDLGGSLCWPGASTSLGIERHVEAMP
jgi:hypothetical protein